MSGAKGGAGDKEMPVLGNAFEPDQRFRGQTEENQFKKIVVAGDKFRRGRR